MTDKRKLEKTRHPGIYRRHAGQCPGNGRCSCPYVVRWKRGDRSHKQMFRTLELAREFQGKLNSGKSTRRPLSSQTIADYYDTWIESYRGRTARGLEPSSRREYEISFRLHILPLIGRMRIRDVAAPDVRDWLGALECDGATQPTIRKAKAALGVLLASAVQDGDIGANPCTGVRYVPSEAARRAHPWRRRRELGAEDVTRILAVMDERWQAFFMLLTQTGVRVGELLGLTWAHVHLGDDPHIVVAEQFYRGERKKLKTDASVRDVPLSAGMAAWLADLGPGDPGAPVFPSLTGTPLTYSNMYNRVLRPALRESGIVVKTEDGWDYQGVAFHSFRRACGSLLFAQGKTLKQIQGWLRHSQLTTTMNAYIEQVDGGLGSADVWDELLTTDPAGATVGAPEGEEAASNVDLDEPAKSGR